MVSGDVCHTLLKYLKKHRLCLYEKLVIVTCPRQHELFNNQSELFCKCRLENKYLLKNSRANDKG